MYLKSNNWNRCANIAVYTPYQGRKLTNDPDTKKGEWGQEWMGPSYRLISKNCIHFSDTFSK